MTKEGYRVCLHTAHPDYSMDFADYEAHIKKLFSRWTKFEDENSIETMTDIILMDKILATVSQGMSTFFYKKGIRQDSKK